MIEEKTEVDVVPEDYTITIHEATPHKKRRQYLDITPVIELGTLVMEKADLFIYNPEYRKYYNLLCVVVDRLKSSVEYLNKHSRTPKNDAQLITYMTYACMVYDAIGELKNKTMGTNKEKYQDPSKVYFKDICMGKPWQLSESECLTDEEFFEHFRSLSFAHPYETSRRKILKDKYGKQYSPWVIANSDIHPNQIGVMVYSELLDDPQVLVFDFKIMKDYIKYRYSKIHEIVLWFKEMIDKKEHELNAEKVNRSDNAIETLKDILRILKIRYQDFYGRIETLIDFLQYNNCIDVNEKYVFDYKEAIKKIIPFLCDAIDEADYDTAWKIIDDILGNNFNKDGMLDYYYSKASDSYYNPNPQVWIIHRPMLLRGFKSLKLPIELQEETCEASDIYFLLCLSCYNLDQKKFVLEQ